MIHTNVNFSGVLPDNALDGSVSQWGSSVSIGSASGQRKFIDVLRTTL